jgi:hypothetical protein
MSVSMLAVLLFKSATTTRNSHYEKKLLMLLGKFQYLLSTKLSSRQMIIFVTAWFVVRFYVCACVSCRNGEHAHTVYFAVKLLYLLKDVVEVLRFAQLRL